MDEKRQMQKELFEEFTNTDKKKHPRAIFQPGSKRTIILTYEHLIFIVMAFIITAATFFSLGVERGKRLKPESATVMEKKTEQASVEIAALPKEIKEQPVVKDEEAPVQPKEAPKKAPALAYTVQVASYFSKKPAETEALRLEQKGFKPFVLSSGKYYVVCVGEFKKKTEAASTRKRLCKQYPDCFVKKK